MIHETERLEAKGKTLHGPGNTKGGINVPLNSCLTGLDWSVLQIKTKIVSCHTADSKPVKQEVNSTVILPPLVFPAWPRLHSSSFKFMTSLSNHESKEELG